MVQAPQLPPIPAALKNIQPYLKIATSHDERDPVISYWCRLYSLQTGLKLSTKSSEETQFLTKLMDWLETTKKELRSNEAITNDIVAQAHLENWALKLFAYADKNDRASNFGKNVIQSFYTAGLLYDVLTIFGELTDEAAQNRKYAKWKATYLHNCLKNGETPVPGPIKDESEENDLDENSQKESITQPSPPTTTTNVFDYPDVPSSPDSNNLPADEQENIPKSGPSTPGDIKPPSTFMGDEQDQKPAFNVDDLRPNVQADGNKIKLSTEQITKAQKYIKWAGSALNYDDISTAIVNLRKAIHLLSTGEDSP